MEDVGGGGYFYSHPLPIPRERKYSFMITVLYKTWYKN